MTRHIEPPPLTIDHRLATIIRELLDGGITYSQAVDAFAAKYVSLGLASCKGNITRASRKLGVHRNTLHKKLRKYVPVATQPIVGARHRVRPRPQKCPFCQHLKSVHQDHLCYHRDPVTRHLDCACAGREDGGIR